jgi:mono/diheme cytochrome c family protein
MKPPIQYLAALIVLCAGCNDMYDTGRQKPLQESKFYADGLASRPLVEGTVPRGHTRLDEHLYTGKIDGKLTDLFPFPVTADVVKRGQDQYNVFCSPCHSRIGDGRGMIVQRGFPPPNSFHSDSIRVKPAGHYFDAVTNGFGRMYSYASSITPEDRWAIVAYIRALQLSRRVRAAELQPTELNSIAQ